LSDITAWFNDSSAPNILWLCGAPGTGKTTISYSLVEGLKRQQRCAGFFFFEQGKYTPSKLWRSLAYEIARFHPAIESEIHSAVANRANGKLNLNDVQVTFSELVLVPLKTTNTLLSNRNTVLLIDALDQCKQAKDNSWETLLNTLSQWRSLPRNFKLIITSRPRSDIAKAFEAFGDGDIKRVELRTGDDVDIDTNRDVHTYLNHRFAEVRRQDKSILEHRPNSDVIPRLVDHTRGFFKWAAVAVDSIQSAGDKEKQLTAIIDDGTATTLKDFDQYLQEIMNTVFEANPFEAFRATTGTIALSKQPLTMSDLEHLLQNRFPSSSGGSLEATCYKLLPIISIEGENKAMKIRHKAYTDYLTDPQRCTQSEFLIDQSKAHRKMTISCLKIMQQELKFNICGLRSSYRMNNEVEDKDALIEKYIPSYLAYACQYWADHLRGITTIEKRDREIVDLLRSFFDSHLLYWLEVLSLLSKSHVAPKSLLVAAEWLQIGMFKFRGYILRSTIKNLSLMAADASRFSFTSGKTFAVKFAYLNQMIS
jgi:hypothetical protein